MDYSTDLLNALVLITNYVLIPSISYGSQLALGAVGVTLVFGILRFAKTSVTPTAPSAS
jgi:branched-chain amino acid transport system permease protein